MGESVFGAVAGVPSVAVARKLAVVMHAMWVDGTFYCGAPATRAADVSARAAAKDKKLLGAHA
jgi:transposase